MRLSYKDRETLQTSIEKYLVKNGNTNKADVVNYFKKQGYVVRTIYRMLDRISEGKPSNQSHICNVSKIWKGRKTSQLKRLAKNKVGVSLRNLGRKFAVSPSTIRLQLIKSGIHYRKRKKTPLYDELQAVKAKKLSRKLVNELYKQGNVIIMDDEKYFTFSCHDMPQNSGFYTDDIKSTPNNVKYKGKAKFPKKILVWIAISERGLSKPLIRFSDSCSINQFVYKDECLIKRLLPFIDKYHGDRKYIFWPDLASAHYAKSVLAWMNENLNYVSKEINPPNVPQARPIENFWGCLVQKVYEDGWEAKSEDQLSRRIKSKLQEFDVNLLQGLMKGVKGKLRKIADEGVFSLFEKLKIN